MVEKRKGNKKELNIEIQTTDQAFVDNVFENSLIKPGDEIKITDQAKLRYEGLHVQLGADIPPVLSFILIFSVNVVSGVLASWLFNKMQGKNIKKFTIERKEVEIDKGEIKKIIEEKLRVE